jgi:hypothetical protein
MIRILHDYPNVQNSIDLDQQAMEVALGAYTDTGFKAARLIYEKGGHSRSYAVVTLDAAPDGTPLKETKVTGKTASGDTVDGTLLADYVAGSLSLSVLYDTASTEKCQVGGLAVADRVTKGCASSC